MVWFRIESKDGKKIVIHYPAGLDSTITKGKNICEFSMTSHESTCTTHVQWRSKIKYAI